jgi:predicted deacylase
LWALRPALATETASTPAAGEASLVRPTPYRFETFMDPLTAAKTCFSRDYAESRRRFLRAAKAAGATLRTFANGARGPAGERLATDCAWLGAPGARKALVLVAGTHGVEGFCGAGAILDAIAAPPPLARDTALLLVHAINPHGFAWLRRVTEEGVDLNRNFIDFAKPPANPGYDALASAILPPTLRGPAYARAQRRLAAYAEKHGATALQVAIAGGQYRHAKGLFFGGFGPTWSHRTLDAVIADHGLARRRHVAVIDLHTGLGPHGYGEPISPHLPGSRAARRAKAWFGEAVTEPLAGSSAAGARHGFSTRLWEKRLGDRVTFIALEFGTYDTMKVVRPALVADHWLHRNGAPRWAAPQTRAIKAALRRAFYPDTDSWREAVIWRSRQIARQAAEGLKEA